MIDKLDMCLKPSAKLSAVAAPLFRILTSLIFIIGGLGHFGQHQVMLDRMEQSPWKDWVIAIGDPSILLWLSGGIRDIWCFPCAWVSYAPVCIATFPHARSDYDQHSYCTRPCRSAVQEYRDTWRSFLPLGQWSGRLFNR